MTTTVHIHTQGNKAVEVQVVDQDGNNTGRQVSKSPILPGEVCTTYISGGESVKVTETGGFLS